MHVCWMIHLLSYYTDFCCCCMPSPPPGMAFLILCNTLVPASSSGLSSSFLIWIRTSPSEGKCSPFPYVKS